MKKKYLAFLPLIIALVLELLYFSLNLGREFQLTSDSAVYAILSKRLLAGDFWNGIHTYWNPGFPIATIPFYLLSGKWETAQVLVSMASIMLLTGAAYLFFKRFSIFLSVCIAFLIVFSSSLYGLVFGGGITEPLYIMLLWVSLYLGWRTLNSDKLIDYVYTTVFFSFAYLTRTEGLPIFAFFVLLAILKRLQVTGNLTKKLIHTFKGVVFILAVFIIINAPYVIIQSLHIGRITLSGKYAYIGSGPYYAEEKYRPTTWAQDVWAVDFNYFKSPYYDPKRANDWMIKYFKNGTIFQNAQKSLKEIFVNYQSINTNTFFAGWGLKLALIGLILGLAVPNYRKITLYFGSMFVIGIVWIATFMSPHYRYLVFALPFFIYLEGLVIYLISNTGSKILVYITQSIGIKNKKIFGFWQLFLLIIFLVNIFNQNMTVDQFTKPTVLGTDNDYKIIAEYIKSQNLKLIGGRMEGIEFYSGAKIVYMPSSPPDRIVKYMKAWGVEYLLVRPQEVGYAFVAPIANPKFKHPDLTLVKEFNEGSLIWKVGLTNEDRINNQRTLVENQWGNK